ncbi:MAG: hypothetical protein ACC631_08815, partial [Halocynthiibacter sp.]
MTDNTENSSVEFWPKLKRRAVNMPAVMVPWLRQRILWFIAFSAAAAIISFFGNFYFIVWLNEGTTGTPLNGITLLPQTEAEGKLFWRLAGGLLFGLAAYWHAVGTRRFWAGIFSLPQWLSKLFQENPRREMSFLLIGVAAGLYYVVEANYWIMLLVALALVFLATSRLVEYFVIVVALVWLKLAKTAGRTAARPFLYKSSVSAALLGIALTYLVLSLIGTGFPQAGFAIIAFVVALRLAIRPAGAVISILTFLILALLLYFFGFGETAMALADDGGFSENGGTIDGAWNGDGSESAKDASGEAALSGAQGAAGGAVAGDLAASSDDDEADKK